MPACCASSCAAVSFVSRPSILTVPVSAPPIDARRQPNGAQAQRRLAGAVGTDQADDAARFDGEVDAAQRLADRAGVAVRDGSHRQGHERRLMAATSRAPLNADASKHDRQQHEAPAQQRAAPAESG